MRIAVTYDSGEITPRFGKVKEFMVYDIENGVVKQQYLKKVQAEDLDEKAAVLRDTGAGIIICGNVCLHCQENIRNYGIEIIGCVQGDADAAVAAYLAGTLHYETDPDILK